ncbi:MAG: V-type ATP synthase subunit A [Candidatus Hodarchaeales archaeon]
MSNKGLITHISGPVIFAKGLKGPQKNHIVKVGKEELLGEIVQIKDDIAIIQVYEDTSGLGIKEPVIDLKKPLTITLGPGLLGNVFDGVQRPLELIEEDFIPKGIQLAPIDPSKKWDFVPNNTLKIGQKIKSGDILGYVQETPLITQKVLVPPNKSGVLTEIRKKGYYSISDTIAHLDSGPLYLVHEWPVRIPRPFNERLGLNEPFFTGQRILDYLFPLAAGGAAMIPGGFGTGKTVLERTLAKYSSTDIMVLVLCGERGNEIADALSGFLTLEDPRSKRLMIERTCIIANTSNMPVAAREASVYAGITIAEFYRDQGYRVSLLADSTSRWAEALREISGRLGEIPGEEGFPSYLPKLIGQFYERAGLVSTLSKERGSVTIIGAVSPQGGDFSEPVTQYSLRFTSTLWALDTELARSRHYPAVSWKLSYSGSLREIFPYMEEEYPEWKAIRGKIQYILQQEQELERIVRLIGKDTLSETQNGLLLVADIIKEGFLQQSAVSEADAYCPFRKTHQMAKIFVDFFDLIQRQLDEKNLNVDFIYEDSIVEQLKRLKELDEESIVRYHKDLPKEISDLVSRFKERGFS